MSQPNKFDRIRRQRASQGLRRMFAETDLNSGDFIYPMFIMNGRGERRPILPMPGCFQISPDEAVREAREVSALGIPAVLLFGLPRSKDTAGTSASDPGEAVQTAVRQIKDALPELAVITDVCLCEYTDHGHCGVMRQDGTVDNDATLPLLARAAVSHAAAGADMVAPSAMMDGQVAAIRTALDGEGLGGTLVMGYSAKYASAFFGPFRVAADSAPKLGDRRAYQMQPGQKREALREVEADISEGADAVMVKPALAYLDVIEDTKLLSSVPVAAYNVSGEYAMVKAAAANGWLDERRATLEILSSIKRAGADLIISYHAKDAVRWLQGWSG